MEGGVEQHSVNIRSASSVSFPVHGISVLNACNFFLSFVLFDF